MRTRLEAWNLLQIWTKSESLIKHALAVEAALRFYARKFHQDEELWGNTGLLHDFDYERHPTSAEHPEIGMAELRKSGWPEEMITAIGGHAQYLNIPRQTLLDKTLFAVDELCGLIMAVAYTRPNSSLAEVSSLSVMKKMKDKAFARGVSRDDVRQGAEELEIPLEEHTENCILALRGIAKDLGL